MFQTWLSRSSALRSLLLLVFLLSAAPAGPASAQAPPQTDVPAPAHGNLMFTADISTSRGPDGRPVAHLYLELPYQSLHFVRARSDWFASCDITVIAYQKHDDQLTGDSWTIPIHSPNDPETRDVEENVYRRRFDLPVVPGRLKFEIRVEQQDSGRTGDWVTTLDVPDFAVRPVTISDFCFGLPQADSLPHSPEWGDSGCFPWPRRRYGEERPLQCVRGYIYDSVTAPDSIYHLVCQIQNATGHTVRTWTEEVRRSGGQGDFVLHPTISDLTLGPYRLKLEAQIGREKAKRERSFEIDESRVNILDDPKMIRIVLGYVARSDEILKLEDLPADSLQGFWNDFWRRRDPTPGTIRNERLTEFLRRLEYVNSHFSIIDPGWTSDMGRTWIRYGAPDEVDRTAYSNAGPPREVWYYVQRGLRFVFLDTEGFGRYRLAGTGRQ